MKHIRFGFLAITVVLSALNQGLWAAEGDLDTSYGTNGKTAISMGVIDTTSGGTIQTDGKMILVGGARPAGGTIDVFAAVRFNANGTVDTTFANNGSYSLDISPGTLNRATAVGLQSDGKIIIGGFSGVSPNQDFTIIRLTAAGVLDTTFGTNGIKTLDFAGKNDQIYALKVLSDDSIVIAGNTTPGAVVTEKDLVVFKINSTGALDTSFGTNGYTTINDNTYEIPSSMAVQSDGKILVAGSSGVSSATVRSRVSRFNANGSIDTAFGTNGVQAVNISFSTNDLLNAILVQSDNKILVAGTSSSMNNGFVARLDTTGALDTTFNSTGYNTMTFGPTSQLTTMVLQSNNNIIAAGQYVNTAFDTVVIKIKTDGTLDTAFGTNGVAKLTIAANKEIVRFAGIQSSGNVVLGLTMAETAGLDDFGAARLIFGLPGDVTAPTVASISIPSNGTYGIGKNLDIAVTFSETVYVGNNPFIVLNFEASPFNATYTSGSGSNTLIFRKTVAFGETDPNGIVAANSITLNGGWIKDAASNNAVVTGLTYNSLTGVLVDGVVPSVASIVRANPNPANAASQNFTVTFSEPVTGVDASDFTLTQTGVTGASITSVTGSGSTYTVTVNVGSGDGSVRLDLTDDDSIVDAAGNKLGDVGLGSGNFTAGESYTVLPAPSITSALTASITYGGSLNYTVTASNSPNAFVATGLPAGTSFNTTTGAITGRPTVAGTFNVSLAATNAGGTGASSTLVVTIGKKALTVTGLTATSKVYNQVLNADISGTPVLNGIINSDNVTLAGFATGEFTTKNVGTNKSVKILGLTLAGADASKYVLNDAFSTADIIKRSVTVTGVVGNNKVYDATVSATLNLASSALNGIIAGDDAVINLSAVTGSFSDKNVGQGKTVSVAGIVISGADSINYILTQPTITADITKKPVTVTGFVASNKAYDRTTTASVQAGLIAMNGVVSGDVVSFNGIAAGAFESSDVGNNKNVVLSGLTLVATDAGNYSLTLPNITANITPVNLTVTGLTANNKVYDGSNVATLNTTNAALNGVISGDTVGLSFTNATAVFQNKNEGVGKAINISGVVLNGANANNYTLTQPSATGDITKKELAVAGITASNKTYDGNATAVVSTAGASLTGVVTNDNVSPAGPATGTFNSKTVGAGKTVTIAGITLAGTDAANYTITQPTTTADITKATLTLNGLTINSKTYDGNANANVNIAGAALVGVISSDVVNADLSAVTGTYNSKNAGTAKPVMIANAAINGTDSANYTLTQPIINGDITTKGVSFTGFTSANKVYDGTLTASVNGSNASIVGLITNDTVTINTANAAATFANKNAGQGKTVSITGIALNGLDSLNYSITAQPSATADISVKAVTASGYTAVSKVYDGKVNAAINGTGTINGAITNDDVAITGVPTGSFADKNVGQIKLVAVSGVALTGADAGNYSITISDVKANITPLNLTVNGAFVFSKVYDRTLIAPLNLLSANLVGVLSGDSVTIDTSLATAAFVDASAGKAKNANFANIKLSGADAINYTVTQPTVTAEIVPKEINLIGITIPNKTYDGTTNLAFNGIPSVSGIIDGDVVTLAPNLVLTTKSKDAATYTDLVYNNLALDGVDAKNYTLATPALSATISPANLTMTGITALDKVYDGEVRTNLSIDNLALVGLIPGDIFNVSLAGAFGNFLDSNVGQNKSVLINGTSISGADTKNYTLKIASLKANIVQATIGLTMTNLAHTYDKTPKNAIGIPVVPSNPANPGTTSLAVVYMYDGVLLPVSTTDMTAFANAVGKTIVVNVNGATGLVNGTDPFAVNSNVSAAALQAGLVTLGQSKNVNVKILENGLFTFDGEATGNYRTTAPIAAGNYTVAASVIDRNYVGFQTETLRIAKANATVSGLTVAPKEYDGTTNATLNSDNKVISGIIIGDIVTFDFTNIKATFNDKIAGGNIPATVSGVILGGTDGENYNLVYQPLMADIYTKALLVAGISVNDKVYDGTNVATLNGSNAVLSGMIKGDDVSIDTTNVKGLFDNKNVGSNKQVSITGLALNGKTSGNYQLLQPGAMGNITVKNLQISGITSEGQQVYDGSTRAYVRSAGASLVGLNKDDIVSLNAVSANGAFANKNVGTNKVITLTNISISGPDAGNYSLTIPTITATVYPKSISLNGLRVIDRAYDGSVQATLTNGTLEGVVSGDNVTVTNGTASFATATPGAGKPVTLQGFSLGGTDAGNYALSLPSSLTATILKGVATVVVTDIVKPYSGSPVAVANVATVPGGLSVKILYGSSETPPTNVGTYKVTATVSDANYDGVGNGSVEITKAAQTIKFLSEGLIVLGNTINLSATASSELPVKFEITSGNASLKGSSLTFTESGVVKLKIYQDGNSNYEAAVEVRTFTIEGKKQQTIDFASLRDRKSNESNTVELSASASSGLPITYTVNGPANLSGAALLRINGTGVITVRANQAGNNEYDPAKEVVRSFNVTTAAPDIFFGKTGNNDTIAASIDTSKSTGTIIGYLNGTKEGFVVTFKINPDGTFEATINAMSSTSSSQVEVKTEGLKGQIVSFAVAAAPAIRTFKGTIVNGVISGSITELNLSFQAQVQPSTGSSASVAGFYQASSSSASSTYSIIGTQGDVYVLAASQNGVTAGSGTVKDNSFTVQTSQGVINAAVTNNTVNGTVTINGKTETFAGVSETAIKTDRLSNLSSRSKINAQSNLITGFVIGGTEPKKVLLRAVGPTLGDFGVAGVVSNPKLKLFNSQGVLVMENDDWSGSELTAAFTQLGAFAFKAGSKDAALLVTLPPGAYTMQVIDETGTGVALAEIYDASSNTEEPQKLINISSRGTVESGEGVLIGGFVIRGNAPKRVLIRGVGPALADFGVTGALSDPRLTVFSGQTVVGQNDNWSDSNPNDLITAAQSAGAFAFKAGSKDAAVIMTLAPGAYTAQVASVNATNGVALIEIYELP